MPKTNLSPLAPTLDRCAFGKCYIDFWGIRLI